jgi:hypothetical protein
MSTPTIPEPEAPERDARAEMREAIRQAGWTPELERAHNDAILAFRRQYPRHHAAIRDRQDGKLLPVPLLVAVAEDYDQLKAQLRALPAEQQREVMVEFFRPVGQAMGYACPQ